MLIGFGFAWVAMTLLAIAALPATSHDLIAIGDLHGDLTNAIRALKMARLVDDDLRWAGGAMTLVQLGDIADRGPHSHTILEMFERLKVEARADGGEVITLLGNHEVMNMKGELTFVAPGELGAFGGRGHFLTAMNPKGSYGAILGTLDCVVIRNGTVFVHAGLLPQFATRGVDKINEDMRTIIRTGDWFNALSMNDGPIWTRELIQRYDTSGDCSLLDETLQILSAQEAAKGRGPVTRMVVGHTIQPGGKMMDRCKGRLVAIDICVSAYYVGCGYLGFLQITHDPLTPGGTIHRANYPSTPNFGKHPINDTVALPALLPHDPNAVVQISKPSSLSPAKRGADKQKDRLGPHPEEEKPEEVPALATKSVLPTKSFFKEAAPRPRFTRPPRNTFIAATSKSRPPYELLIIAVLIVVWRLRHIYVKRTYKHKKNDSAASTQAI